MSSPSAALLRAIESGFPGCQIRIDSIRSRDWASATYAAVRHEIVFTLLGDDGAASADAFLDGLEDREFPMPGHILIDIALVSRTDAPDAITIAIEALTIEDA